MPTMSFVRRLLAIVVLLALFPVGSAFADHFDPKRKIRPSDQARAKAMLLRKSDLAPGYAVGPSEGSAHLNCAPIDESDLTLNGEAESPIWIGGLTFIRSAARVYTSISDANASWRRTTSAPGRRCVATELQRLAGANGGRLVSLKELPFTRVAPRTVVFRMVFEARAQGALVQLTLDLVGVSRSRALAYFFFASAAGAPSKAEELRLARIVAARMASAMRAS
jgi:hypothetical protein